MTTSTWRSSLGIRSAAALAVAALGLSGPAVASRRPALHANSQHYKAERSSAAKGRAGSATLEARALTGQDGKTVLELSTGSVDDPATARGAFSKVQLKTFDAKGKVRSTQNFKGLSTPTLTLTFTDLARGQPFQVQANERGIDGARTDVVTVRGTVQWRPDLGVARLSLPATAAVGTPVNVSAEVREHNGDVGASADCVLSVDGAEADRSAGIWVGAGDTVSCAFVHVFPAAGEHAVSVAVERISPTDDDAGDDRASGQITVTQPSHFRYSASILSYSYESSSTSSSSYSSDNGTTTSGNDFTYTTRSNGFTQQADFAGQVDVALAFPLSVEVKESSDGNVVSQVSFTGITADEAGVSGAEQCTSRMDDATAAYLYVCSVSGAVAPQTSVTYTRYAGDVTYFSSQFTDTWFRDDATGETTHDTWAYNMDYSQAQGAPVTVGSKYGFAVRLSSGEVSYSADAAIDVAPFEINAGQPLTCEEYGDGASLSRTCSEWSEVDSGVKGEVTGG